MVDIVFRKTLLAANSLVKNINVDLEQDNFGVLLEEKYPCIKSATNGKYLEMTVFGFYLRGQNQILEDYIMQD